MKSALIALVLGISASHGGDLYPGEITLTNVERESARLYKWHNYEFTMFSDCPYRHSEVRAYILLEDEETPARSIQCGEGLCHFTFERGQKCIIKTYEVVGPTCVDR